MVKDFEKNVYSESLVAGADLSAKQYYAVKLNSSGKIILAGAGEFAVGVLLTDPKSNEVGQVLINGAAPVVYGASVTAGTLVKSNVNGKAVPCSTGDQFTLGVALEDGASGEVHTIILNKMFYTI